MKLITLLTLLLIITITSCDEIQNSYLYDENDPGYAALKEQAALECIEGNDIFDNLKTSDFTSYSILGGANASANDGDDHYIKISDDVYLWISEVTATKVEFTVVTELASLFSTFLTQKTFTISDTENNAIVDMIATGVCSGDYYKGTPSASSSQLTFEVNNYNIQDSTDVFSTTVPGEYRLRKDNFTMSTSIPAFLFIWGGSYSAFEKDADETEQAASFVNLELAIANSTITACSEKFSLSKCRTQDGLAALDIDTEAYDSTRQQNNDDILKTYYFTNFAP